MVGGYTLGNHFNEGKNCCDFLHVKSLPEKKKNLEQMLSFRVDPFFKEAVCVCVRVCACVRACVCACVCV